MAHDLVLGSSGREVVVFAHGILGSRTNWKSFARTALRSSGLGTLTVDLRNHGQSHGFAPPHSVQAAADDVGRLCAHLDLRPRLLVGHSWGGKAMAQLALDNVDVNAALIVDAPFGIRVFGQALGSAVPIALGPRARGEGTGGDGSIEGVIDVVSSVAMPVRSRKELVEILLSRGLSLPLAQWMTTNLDEQLNWKFDLAAIGPMLLSFGALDLWPAMLAHRPGLAIHLARGGRSDRWTVNETARVVAAAAAGVVVDHVLEGAGHWVHTDDPEGLLAVLMASLAP